MVSNLSEECSDHFFLPERPLSLVVFESGVTLSVLLAGFVSNIIICAVIFRNPHLQTISNWLILNMSVCDILKGIFCLTICSAVLIQGRWTFGEVFCKIDGFYTLFLLISSLLSVTLISFSRYVLISKATSYSSIFSKRNTMLMLGGCWLISLMSGIPPFLGWGRYDFISNRASCFIATGSNNPYVTVLAICFIGMPFTCICWCSYKILKAVKESKNRVIVVTPHELETTPRASVVLSNSRQVSLASNS